MIEEPEEISNSKRQGRIKSTEIILYFIKKYRFLRG